MGGSWIETQCALCGGRDATGLFEVPHPDAPAGRSWIVRCRACGLRRLDPRPGPELVGRYYAAASGYNAYAGRTRSPRKQAIWDFLRDGYAAPANGSVPARALRPLTRSLAAWLFDINVPLDGRRGLRVLEIGSGYGDILIYLKSRGCQVLGTDLSPAAVAAGAAHGTDIRLGNLAELNLASGSFDVAIMCHSLEHVPDPNIELRELGRLLAPEGRLHIALPNGSAVRLRLDGPTWAHLSHPFHFWFFDRDSLGKLLDRHGFAVVESMTTTRHHALMAWLNALRSEGVGRPTARFARFARESLRTPDGGDVLRIIARRTGNQLPDP